MSGEALGPAARPPSRLEQFVPARRKTRQESSWGLKTQGAAPVERLVAEAGFTTPKRQGISGMRLVFCVAAANINDRHSARLKLLMISGD